MEGRTPLILRCSRADVLFSVWDLKKPDRNYGNIPKTLKALPGLRG